MIRYGMHLADLHPGGIGDILVANFETSSFDICLQACVFPRWFDLDLLLYSLRPFLTEMEIRRGFDQLLETDFVNPYGELGHYVRDTERYYFLNIAFRDNNSLGQTVLKRHADYFAMQAMDPSDAYRDLIDKGYFDLLPSLEIESFHLRVFDTEVNLDSHLKSTFNTFLKWRSDPFFNESINRRLVKALRDHVKMGTINSCSALLLVDAMRVLTRPWSNESANRLDVLYRAVEAFADNPFLSSILTRELAKTLGKVLPGSGIPVVRKAFEDACYGLCELNEVYHLAECERSFGAFLTQRDGFSEADAMLHKALASFEKAAALDDVDYGISKLECWRLIGWNYYYWGPDHHASARHLAETHYVNLKMTSQRYMASLFAVLLAKVRTESSSFLQMGELFDDTLKMLGEAATFLRAVPHTTDYPTALTLRVYLDLFVIERRDFRAPNVGERLSQASIDLDTARLLYDERNSEDGINVVNFWEGVLLNLLGERSSALERFSASLSHSRKKPDQVGVFNCLLRSSFIYVHFGDYESASDHLEEAATIATNMGWVDRFNATVRTTAEREPEIAAALYELIKAVSLD